MSLEMEPMLLSYRVPIYMQDPLAYAVTAFALAEPDLAVPSSQTIWMSLFNHHSRRVSFVLLSVL